MTTLLAVLALNRIQDVKADLFIPTARLETLVGHLSNKFGERVQVTADVKDQMVFVSVKNRSLGEVLNAVCYATDTEWKRENGVVAILRGPQLKARLAAERRTYRIKNIQKQLDRAKAVKYDQESLTEALKKVDALVKKGGENVDWLEYQKYERFDPCSRACDQLLASLGPEDILTLADRRRTVFSLSPTNLQLPMPRGLTNVLADVNKWRQWLSEAMQKAGIAQQEDMEIYSNLVNPYRKLDTPLASCRLVVTGQDSALSVAFTGYDAEGDPVESGSSYLGLDYDQEEWQGRKDPPKSLFPDARGKILPSAEDEPLLGIPMQFMQGKTFEDKAKRGIVIDYLAKAMNQDPLIPSARTVLPPAIGDKELVTAVTDYTFAGWSPTPEKELKSQLVMFNVTYMKEANNGGIRTFRFDSDLNATMYDVPRQSIAAVATAIKSANKVSLDDLANSVSWATEEQVAQLVLRMALSLANQPDSGSFYGSGQGILPLRVYGTLNAAQRRDAAKPGGIVFNVRNTQPALRQLIEKYVRENELNTMYGEAIMIGEQELMAEVGDGQVFTPVPDGPQRNGQRNNDIELNGFQSEQTFFLAQPYSQPWSIKVEVLRGDAYLLRNNRQWGSTNQIGELDSLANQIAWNRKMKESGQEYYRDSTFSFGAVKSAQIKLTLKFGRVPEFAFSFKYCEEPAENVVDLSQLKDPLKSQLEAEVAKKYKDIGEVQFGGRSQRNVPPYFARF